MRASLNGKLLFQKLTHSLGAANDRPWAKPVIRKYLVRSQKINRGFRIVHLSDLHCCYYGAHQERLCRLIDRAKPDLICMTGDMLEPKFSPGAAGELFSYVAEKYPCYFVTGNHEYNYRNYQAAKAYVRSFGIGVLDDRGEWVTVGKAYNRKVYNTRGEKSHNTAVRTLDSGRNWSGQEIYICGIDDPTAPNKDWKRRLYQAAAAAGADPARFTLFLTHRPERAALYAKLPFDLVLSGHAHGGQWRLPGFRGGLFAPCQGLFPKYAGGRYDFGAQTHINSRGLAYYVPVPRFFNPVEFGVIDVVPVCKNPADHHQSI